jgi:alkyl hydroperoxide reductase subunit F
MLDANIVEQLKGVFSKLSNTVELVYDECDHADQKALLEMLDDISSTSKDIKVRTSSETSTIPRFHIEYRWTS